MNDLSINRGASYLDDLSRLAADLAGGAHRAKDGHQPGAEGAPAGDSVRPATWPDPQPLTAKTEAEPYPLDALPAAIGAAVEEVAGFVQAPLPLVAAAALSALSVTCQAHADVQRAVRLSGPASLFMLSLGDSGERKTTCDTFFTTAIREYEAEQAEIMKPVLQRFEADHDAWKAKRSGILQAITELSKKSKPTDELQSVLAEVQRDEPEAPRVPRLLLGDETPENLAWGLAKRWPSAGVVSSEAGVIFGAHGMSKDSVMRNLGLLNILWDGKELSIGRRTSESFVVRGARLTLGLMIQEETLRTFFAQSGALARGSGFLARFLLAWPETTQGSRPFADPPATWPRLAAFNRRIAEILNWPAPIGEDGALKPAMMTLTQESKAAWVEFHNEVERELAPGGDLHAVRDVAAKSADNAARLAVMFHVFGHGTGGAIGLDSFEGASRIAAWHLNEARRFFGELALPAEMASAVRLDSWLIEHCQRVRTHMVGKNHVRQHGPLRDGSRLDAAIGELVALDRLRLVKEGRRLTLLVNPALVGVAA
ncbi:MAG: YfjI family protein [Accumulibacter sp.]|jgi:putative DNA primase/helicase|uniref:YfjI family protein n=1 Tax=Accumulibacter sp. TaxID=2053492 RepID=UPI002FC39250